MKMVRKERKNSINERKKQIKVAVLMQCTNQDSEILIGLHFGLHLHFDFHLQLQ